MSLQLPLPCVAVAAEQPVLALQLPLLELLLPLQLQHDVTPLAAKAVAPQL